MDPKTNLLTSHFQNKHSVVLHAKNLFLQFHWHLMDEEFIILDSSALREYTFHSVLNLFLKKYNCTSCKAQHYVTAVNGTIILFTRYYLCSGNKRIVISRETMRFTNQAFTWTLLLHFLLLVIIKSKLQIGK